MLLHVFDIGGQKGQGHIVSGEVGGTDDGKGSDAGSEDREGEVGVIGGEVGKPEVAVSEQLGVDFGQVAHVPEGEEPGDENGDLHEVAHGY